MIKMVAKCSITTAALLLVAAISQLNLVSSYNDRACYNFWSKVKDYRLDQYDSAYKYMVERYNRERLSRDSDELLRPMMEFKANFGCDLKNLAPLNRLGLCSVSKEVNKVVAEMLRPELEKYTETCLNKSHIADEIEATAKYTNKKNHFDIMLDPNGIPGGVSGPAEENKHLAQNLLKLADAVKLELAEGKDVTQTLLENPEKAQSLLKDHLFDPCRGMLYRRDAIETMLYYFLPYSRLVSLLEGKARNGIQEEVYNMLNNVYQELTPRKYLCESVLRREQLLAYKLIETLVKMSRVEPKRRWFG